MKARQIELKTLTDDSGDFRYSEFIKVILETASPAGPNGQRMGITFRDMRKREPILAELEKLEDGDVLHLDEDKWQLLSNLVRDFPWARQTDQNKQFCVDITEAKAVEIETPKKKEDAEKLPETEPDPTPTDDVSDSADD